MSNFKSNNILYLLAAGAVFIAALYWINGGNSGTKPSPEGSGIYKNLLKQISDMEQKPWQVQVYSSIKGKVLGASSAGELSENENNSLSNLLEIAKSKSLVLSYDEAKNNQCLNPSGLTFLTRILIDQKKIVKLPEADKRILMYQNLQKFLALGSQVEAMKKRAYDELTAKKLETGIRSAATRTGVTECGASQTYMSDWLNKLYTYKKVYTQFDYIEKNNINLPEDYSIDCDMFMEYPYYSTSLNGLGRCL
jgi:hypothetical protein